MRLVSGALVYSWKPSAAMGGSLAAIGTGTAGLRIFSQTASISWVQSAGSYQIDMSIKKRCLRGSAFMRRRCLERGDDGALVSG